jgi:putative FmdB family regulatory protein
VEVDMALYYYTCKKCGEKFELFRNRQEDDSGVRCPKCEASEVERAVPVFEFTDCGCEGCGESGFGCCS